jgi:hypothetical protein
MKSKKTTLVIRSKSITIPQSTTRPTNKPTKGRTKQKPTHIPPQATISRILDTVDYISEKASEQKQYSVFTSITSPSYIPDSLKHTFLKKVSNAYIKKLREQNKDHTAIVKLEVSPIQGEHIHITHNYTYNPSDLIELQNAGLKKIGKINATKINTHKEIYTTVRNYTSKNIARIKSYMTKPTEIPTAKNQIRITEKKANITHKQTTNLENDRISEILSTANKIVTNQIYTVYIFNSEQEKNQAVTQLLISEN